VLVLRSILLSWKRRITRSRTLDVLMYRARLFSSLTWLTLLSNALYHIGFKARIAHRPSRPEIAKTRGTSKSTTQTFISNCKVNLKGGISTSPTTYSREAKQNEAALHISREAYKRRETQMKDLSGSKKSNFNGWKHKSPIHTVDLHSFYTGFAGFKGVQGIE